MFCKYCGKQIEDDSRFCKYCGKDVSGELSSSSSVSIIKEKHGQLNQIEKKTEIKKTAAHPKENSTKKISAKSLFIAVFCFILVLLAICFFVTQKANESVPDLAEVTEDTTCVVEDPTYSYNEHITIPKGDCFYTGHINENRLPEGEGIARFDNGEVYEGTFVNGNFSKGRCTWNNGVCFDGTFENNDPYTGSLSINGTNFGIVIAKKYYELDSILNK